jgi:hypothetical protein
MKMAAMMAAMKAALEMELQQICFEWRILTNYLVDADHSLER